MKQTLPLLLATYFLSSPGCKLTDAKGDFSSEETAGTSGAKLIRVPPGKTAEIPRCARDTSLARKRQGLITHISGFSNHSSALEAATLIDRCVECLSLKTKGPSIGASFIACQKMSVSGGR
ncbi:MAG: hypothetical protein NTV34_08125 [Proteobacteria bacterium]|nr:hypothetical protein [Pseudomonadota bacterium]